MAKRSIPAAPGTTDQLPRWEGPEENRPRGYLPAVEDPDTARDAAGENLSGPDKRDLSDAFETGGDSLDEARERRIQKRAYELWERAGRQDGTHEKHWHDAVREIDEEDSARPIA
ncbi:DUF2934 domain-containing protein [Mesorhizobium sp. ASY16-5R]|uniref:DUF2934 domain-containing protein n=1 Tax=Mesorhizobium sp. ASY16-5R TaxID=3445772 RepID=UPI003F9F0D0D